MLIRLLNKLCRKVLPFNFRKRLESKINDTAYIIKSNKKLSFIFSVAFLPFTIVWAILKVLTIWVIPISWKQLLYIIEQYLSDIGKEGLDKKTARKRARLTYEMITKGKEKFVSFGQLNPDKTFYVIRPYYFMKRNELATSLSDLLFHYYRNLHQLSHAIEEGWIPVVDWENYGPFRHAEDQPVNGKKNCWEYYWSQPSQYTLEEVYHSKNVILANRNSVDYGYIPSMFFYKPYQKYVNRLAVLCPEYDCYFEFNKETKQYIESKQQETFPQGKRILGVSVRAMAYGSKILKNHPIQPTFKQLIMEIEKAMNDWEMDCIYFCCESEEYVNRMKDIFGEKLIYLKRRRYSKEPEIGQKDEDNELYKGGRRYQTNLDYVTEMALLSRCTALLSSMSGGVRVAVIWNQNRYEQMRIIEGEEWEWKMEEKNTAVI